MTGITGAGDPPAATPAVPDRPAPRSDRADAAAAATAPPSQTASAAAPAAPFAAAQIGAINGSTLVVAGGGVSLANLRTALSTVFSRFYDGAELLRVVDRAMQAVLPLIERSAGAVSFRIVAVDTLVGGDPRFGAAARISGLGLEVGAIRGGGLGPQDVRLLSLDGAEVPVADAARAEGLARGRYEIAAGDAGGASDARLEEALQALRRLSETVDALTSFRRGDASALDRLKAGLARDADDAPAAAV